jgi:long-chain acyl-CoA synthetase
MNITHGLRRAMQINARGIATIDGDRARTWAEVGARVARLAGGLVALGVRPGDRVAILALNSDRYLETYLATAWAGAVIVPLNIRWSLPENADAMADCRAGVLLFDRAYATIAAELAATLPGSRLIHLEDDVPTVGILGYEALIASAEPLPPELPRSEDLAGIFYTGGTTGRSKGVMLSHGNLTANALNALAEGLFGASSIYLHAAPMFHLANGGAMYAILLSGAVNVMIKSFSPEAVMAAIQSRRVTDILLVPTMIQMLVDHPGIKDYDLASLKRVAYGASPISEALLDRASSALPGAEFCQAYGMTELSPIATILHWREHTGEGRRKGRHRSGGRATIGCEVRVVDSDDNPVPPGTIGEIVARGDTVMLGYWERPEETARALAGGWMHTGDGGYMHEDGFVYVVDRVKDMIISGGENVYSIEVENAIARHPAVLQCAVIGIPSEQWGEQVHAVVVRRADHAVTPEEIIAFCRRQIAGYKAPRSVEITEAALPMSGAGKILKRQLREPFWKGKARSVS